MIRRFVQSKESIVATLAVSQAESRSNVANEIATLSPNEWGLLARLEDIFQIFKDITEEVSGEKYVTISKMLVFLKILATKMGNLENDGNLGEDLKKIVQI